MAKDHLQFNAHWTSAKRRRQCWFSFNAKYDSAAEVWRCSVVADYIESEYFNTLDSGDALTFMQEHFTNWVSKLEE